MVLSTGKVAGGQWTGVACVLPLIYRKFKIGRFLKHNLTIGHAISQAQVMHTADNLATEIYSENLYTQGILSRWHSTTTPGLML
jgi:hypothetical protein